MAGVAGQLSGSASDTDLAPRHERALGDAMRALERADDHPALAAALEKLRGVAGEPEGDEIEKSVADMRSLRVALSKSEDASPVLRERVEKAYRDVGLAPFSAVPDE